MPYAGPEIKFTPTDIACEALGMLIKFDLIGAAQIVITGIAYNRAKESGDQQRIKNANDNLHTELYLFKKNFLCRRKHHWHDNG